MDVFTDVDIFKELITATLRGVAVYILLDESRYSSFLAMSNRVGINIQDLKVRNTVMILFMFIKSSSPPPHVDGKSIFRHSRHVYVSAKMFILQNFGKPSKNVLRLVMMEASCNSSEWVICGPEEPEMSVS